MFQDTIKPSFRYDINGLRAIAIIGVVLFHYKVSFFEGGFAGVDVFFVISGYLMSKIVLGTIDRNNFSIKDYFDKRLKRIVPPLLFLILTLTVVCFFIYFPEDYRTAQRNAAGSILFYSDILYWKGDTSYFAASAETNMFLHTWSLSVEWQFYLLYPLLLLLFNNVFKNKSRFKIAFIMLTVILFIFSVIVTNYNGSASFYLLPTRAWEMLFGGIAFFAEDTIISLLWRKVLAIIGYIMIVLCFVFLNETMPWPGFYTLLPVSATFLVIVANYNSFAIIRNVGIQFMGKISYSLYLWHWPVYVIAQYYGLVVKPGFVVLLFLLSTALGYLSFRYIESAKFKKIVIVAGMLLLFCGTFLLRYYNVNKIVFKDRTLVIAGYKTATKKQLANQYKRGTCHVDALAAYKKDLCLCIEEGKKNILLIGDSHLGQLSQSLREHYAGQGVNFMQASAGGTLPTIKSYYNKQNNVRPLMDYVFKDFIPKNANKIDGVIISGSWAGQKSVEPDNILSGIKEVIAYLDRYKIKTLVIGQTERYTVPYATIAARDYQYNSQSNSFYLDDSALQMDDFLSTNLKGYYIKVINQGSYPPVSPKGEPYMTDTHHVTKYGADLIVNKIAKNRIAIRFFDNPK